MQENQLQKIRMLVLRELGREGASKKDDKRARNTRLSSYSEEEGDSICRLIQAEDGDLLVWSYLGQGPLSRTDATTAPARPYSCSPARAGRLCRIQWQVHRRITLLGIIALFPLLSSAESARSEGLWSCQERLSRSSADLYDFHVNS